MNNTYEQEIDIKDLIFYILKKWRTVLSITVIFAILMGGYKLYKGITNYKDEMYIAVQKKTYENELNNFLITKEGYQRNIGTLTQNIDYEEMYEKKSVLFQLNPYNKWVAKADLYIKMDVNNRQNTMIDPADSLVKAYSSILISESALRQASKNNGIEIKYLRELINIEGDFDGNMITITVAYKDGEGAKKILDSILESVNSRQLDLETNFGPHNIIFMNSEKGIIADQELAESQNKRMESLSEMQKSLEETQLALDNLKEPQAPVDLTFNGVFKSAFRYGAMGGIIGIFLTGFLLCTIYVINPRLHSAEEFKSRFGIKIFGAYTKEDKSKKKSCVDVWLNKIEGKENLAREDVLMKIIANISLYTQRKETVLLTGTIELELLNKIQIDLVDSFKELTFEVGSDMNKNSKTLTRLPNIDRVILVEKCGVSKYKDIRNQIETINSLDKKIIGCIIL